MVACKDCVYYLACMKKRKEHGIVDLVPESVQCGRYVGKVMKDTKTLDRQGTNRRP